MAPYDWIISGLAFDLAGSVVLAKGFMLKRAAYMFRESQAVMGSNSAYVKGALTPRANNP